MWGNIIAIHSILKKKTTKLNFQPAQYEKNKIEQRSRKKIIKKGKKTLWGNTIVIHSVLKEKTRKINSQLAQY